MSDQILQELVARLRSSFGDSVRILDEGSGCVALQIGSTDETVLAIRIQDPARPSFTVTYPALALKKDGSRYVREVSADGVARVTRRSSLAAQEHTPQIDPGKPPALRASAAN